MTKDNVGFGAWFQLGRCLVSAKTRALNHFLTSCDARDLRVKHIAHLAHLAEHRWKALALNLVLQLLIPTNIKDEDNLRSSCQLPLNCTSSPFTTTCGRPAEFLSEPLVKKSLCSVYWFNSQTKQTLPSLTTYYFRLNLNCPYPCNDCEVP